MEGFNILSPPRSKKEIPIGISLVVGENSNNNKLMEVGAQHLEPSEIQKRNFVLESCRDAAKDFVFASICYQPYAATRRKHIDFAFFC
jgi:hypothetical protein